MKQKIYITLFLVFIFCFQTENDGVFANENSEEIEDVLYDNLSITEIEQYWSDLYREYGDYLIDLENLSLLELIKNKGSFSIKNLFHSLIGFLFHEIIVNGKLLGLLLLLIIFSALLQSMQAAFSNSSVSKIAYFVVYIVLIFIMLNSFYLTFSYAANAIETMSSFMIALIPLVLGLMATLGNFIAVAFFHPVIIFLIHASGILISKLILPLLFLSALLHIVSNLNENYQVSNLADLIKLISVSVLGAYLTIFLGIMSVQGTVSAVQDGVALKTAKFITGNFIPVIGKTFTEAADTLLSASLILKNGVGVAGVVIIVFIAIFPALKIFAIALIYNIAAAALQPIAHGPMTNSLSIISKYMIYVLACLLIVTLMFFLSIVIIIVSSNITLFMR